MNRTRVTLGEVLRVKHGYAFKGEYFASEGPYVLLTPGSFNEHGGFRDQGKNTKYYNGDVPEGYLLDEGELLIAMTEQAPGLLGSSLLVADANRFLHNQRLGRIISLDERRLIRRYAYYLFNTADVRSQISATATGGKVRHTAPERVAKVAVSLPSVAEQEKVADILAAYDELIENNIRRMALLEEAARQLYREWFVRLRFPGREHTRVVDGVPHGWSRVAIGQVLAHYIGGGWGQDEPTGRETEPAYVIRGADMPAAEAGGFDKVGLRYHDPRTLPHRLLQTSDIIFEVSGGSATQPVGRTLFVSRQLLDAFGVHVICASFCKLFRVAVPSHTQYVFRFLRHIRESGELGVFQKQSASALQNLNFEAFMRKQLILVPPESLLNNFAELHGRITDQQHLLARQNQKLRAARDLLLPRLMSGELAV